MATNEQNRRVDAVFDFDKQAWFTATGEHLEEEPEWVFPCPSCHGPSDCVGASSYYERYECLNCGNRFTVK